LVGGLKLGAKTLDLLSELLFLSGRCTTAVLDLHQLALKLLRLGGQLRLQFAFLLLALAQKLVLLFLERVDLELGCLELSFHLLLSDLFLLDLSL